MMQRWCLDKEVPALQAPPPQEALLLGPSGTELEAAAAWAAPNQRAKVKALKYRGSVHKQGMQPGLDAEARAPHDPTCLGSVHAHCCSQWPHSTAHTLALSGDWRTASQAWCQSPDGRYAPSLALPKGSVDLSCSRLPFPGNHWSAFGHCNQFTFLEFSMNGIIQPEWGGLMIIQLL